MTIQLLLRVMAFIEGATGLSLLFWPPLQARQIMGVAVRTPLEMFLGRSFGTALVAIAIVCWLAASEARGKVARGVVVAMTIYNAIAAALLVHARVVLELSGALYWVGIVVHVTMGAWCIACLQRNSLAE